MSDDPTRRRRVSAQRAELGGTVVAGTVGSGFGAAKLRDEHKTSYPGALQRAVNRHAGKAKRAGVSAERVEQTARRVMVGKPGFKPLAIGTVAGATAAGASHYGDHLKRKRANELRRQRVGKSAHPGVSGRGQQTVSMTGQALRKRAFSLHDMEYDEVSLVDVPANQHAAIMIAKSFQGADMDPDEIFDAEGAPVDEADLTTGDIIYDANNQAYRYTSPEDVTGADDETQVEPELAVAKRGNPLLGLGGRQRPIAKRRQNEGTDLAAAISKALDEASTEAEQVEVIKSFAGAVGQMQARLTMVEKRAEQDRNERLIGEYVEVAKNLALPGVTAEEFGPVLKACGDFLDEKQLEVLSKALDSTSGVLYEEFGYNGPGVEYGDPDNADAEAYAHEAVAKGGKIAKSVHGEVVETPISKAAAVEMYYEQNDQAYDAYLANRR